MHREANTGRGFPSWLLLHYFFSGIFLHRATVYAAQPWLLGRQQWRQRKKELLEKEAAISVFYLAMMKEVHPRTPSALWPMMSCESTFKILTFTSCCQMRNEPVMHQSEEGTGLTAFAWSPHILNVTLETVVWQSTSWESALESPWKPLLVSKPSAASAEG